MVKASTKLGGEEVLRLVSKVSTIIVSKNGQTMRFSMTKNRPNDDALLNHLLGPTGKLRAPTILRGKTMLVGFDKVAYVEALSGK